MSIGRAAFSNQRQQMEASSSENKMLRAQLDADNEPWRRRVTHLQEAQVTAAQEAALEVRACSTCGYRRSLVRIY